MGGSYSRLDAGAILQNVESLRVRVRRDFPDAGLAAVAKELHVITLGAAADAESINQPIRWLRVTIAALLLASPVMLLLGAKARLKIGINTFVDLVTALEAGLGTLVFLGAGVIFLFSLETRMKRGIALAAIHRFRSMAHIIDMHQLGKLPATVESDEATGAVLGVQQLALYLDYCSEMLSLTAKAAALYVQELEDPVVITAVDEIEELTTGLSRKIWQKIIVLRPHQPLG